MKRFVWMMLFVWIFGWTAFAEQNVETAALEAMRTGYPSYEVLQAAQWGDSAAAVLGREAERVLCIARKKDGVWERMIANEAALPLGITPNLYMDTDTSLFWSYADDMYHYRYSSYLVGDVWQAPVCVRMEKFCEGMTFYTEVEHSLTDGLLSFRVSRWDANENLQSEYTVGPFPAEWMESMQTLASYQEDMCPTAAKVQEDSWLNDAALYRTAAEIMPQYTFVDGAATDQGLELLMRDEAGQLRLVTWRWMENGPVTNIGSPLPEGTIYGYENFSNCLRLPDGKVVSVDVFRNGVWHPEYVFPDTAEGTPLFLGRNWVSDETGMERHFYIGDHSWAVLSTDWNSLPSDISQALEKLDASRWAVVHNPNPEDRLHLREQDHRQAASFGKFYNGTPVEVLRASGDWVYVRIPGGCNGWMMKKYLCFGTNGWGVENAFPRMHFVDEKEAFTVWNTGHVLHGEMPNKWTVQKGEAYCIIGVYGDEWYHVWFPELDAGGMMLQSDFWPGNG